MSRTLTRTGTVLALLRTVDAPLCQLCPEGATGIAETRVMRELVALADRARFRGRRGWCAVCRAPVMVFRLHQ
jgi:hypothetical protein